MALYYDPSNRDYTVEYSVSTTGDRFFIPFNTSGTMAQQLAQCKAVVGNQKTNSSAEIGVEVT